MAKTLIAFFSRADENYFAGAMRYVKVGNTESVVNGMKELIDADTFKIEMKNPYSPVYMTCIEEAKKDLRAKARPELVSLPESIDKFDTVVLAYPNYWGTMPMAVFTFLEAFDFTGKTILPLCTNEGSGVKREDVFLSTKLWPSEYENENAVDETLERLGVDYVDLLYIHQPAGNWLAGYRQLEKAYKEGKAKSIGISNFEGKYMEELETKWEIAPQFIQVEAHPYFTQQELRKTLDKYGIKLMSWYPLGHGDKSLLNEPVFAELGKKYGKTPAQIILRWHTQMGFAVIPGSKSVDHIKDNLNILDFRLSDEEMAEIAKLDKGVRYYHRTDEQLVQFAGWRPAFEEQ